MTIFAFSSTNNIALSGRKLRVKILLDQVQFTSKATITSARYSQSNANIIVKEDASKSIEISFIQDEKTIHLISLPKKDFNIASFKTSSIFKDRVEIHPNGFVSPASLTIEAHGGKKCSIFFSRLGNVRKECNS